MADAAKKKRKTRSPSREAAPKRSRVHSVSPSVQSPSTGSDHRFPSKSSSKTTHIAETSPQSTSLPTAEDWVFRVKVLSSANDLENDVFKDAVKGLVRICFPDGILEQLGPFVLQQHMREMKAKPGNIEDATKIFVHEMLQRLVSILAQYLDTPARLITAVRTMVMDSAKAHSESFREDSLGYITTELSRLSEADLGQSTNRLISSDTLHDVSDGDENVDPNNVIVDEPARSRKTKKSKKNSKLRKSKRTQDHDNKLDNDSVGVDLAITHVGKNNPKDKKISSTWEWDVDPVEINGDTVMKAFPRTADLFAYHALPTTKQKLGSEASRKDIRLDMQSTLDNMPHEEFTKWVESLEKLINGDYEILARIEPVVLSEDELSRKTPASVLSNMNTGHSDMLERESTFVKSEIAETSDKTLENIEQAQSNKAVTQNTTIFRHLSTEDWDVEPPTIGVEAADEKHGRSSQINEVVDSAFGMPILQLLWGTDNLTPEQCISDGFKITDTIMNNLQRRVSADRIVVSGLGYANKTRTRAELQNGLIHSFPKPGQSFSYMRIKKNIETSLVPWVVAEPKAFPELKAMPFVFAHTVPSVPVVVNLLFGSWSAVSMLSGSQMWEKILKALQQLGISEASAGAANIDCLQIDSLCNDRKHPETTRRALLERVLRRLAFSHRDRFPELKSSPVVKTWERKTGLTW